MLTGQGSDWLWDEQYFRGSNFLQNLKKWLFPVRILKDRTNQLLLLNGQGSYASKRQPKTFPLTKSALFLSEDNFFTNHELSFLDSSESREF